MNKNLVTVYPGDQLVSYYFKVPIAELGPKWASLAKKGTNSGLFRSDFSKFLVTDFSHLGPI